MQIIKSSKQAKIMSQSCEYDCNMQYLVTAAIDVEASRVEFFRNLCEGSIQ